MEKIRIVLFDGVCNLCNSSVQFIIKRDPTNKFKFAALQSETGMQLLGKYGLSATTMDSIVLIENHNIHTKSGAVLRIASHLKGPIRLLYGCIIIPPFIRNAVYTLIARKRYRWFGKRDSCMIPDAGVMKRFEL